MLVQWLRLIAENGRGRAVIVPGGGAFADTVRSAQAELGFEERCAHRMALLAMAQYGYALCGIDTRLTPARSVEQIRTALAGDEVPVWLPLDLLETHPGIEEGWHMSSDSLSAWLAGRIGAEQLVVVKAARVNTQANLDDLAQTGLVDALFSRYARAAVCAVRVVAGDSLEAIRHEFAAAA
jgi:aspartokinase-like uncharacterized kinase